MKFNRNWLVAAGLTAMVAANAVAFAATDAAQATTAGDKKPAQERKGGGKGEKFLFKGDGKMLEFLKIDAETLKTELQAGKTLAAIAAERGISIDQLKAFMLQQMTQRLDESVTAGKMTAEKAEKIKANMEKHIDDIVNGKGPAGHGKMMGHAPFADDKLLSLLNIDKETLKTQLQAGKTLAAIAGERGVSEEKLKAFMIEQMTQRIDEGVKAGKIDAKKAEEMKAGMADRVSDMINGKGPKFDRGERDKA